MSQTVTARWIQDYTFVGKTDDQHAAIMDASMTDGDLKCAPSPMEMVLLGLVGCAGIDIKFILGKSRKTIKSMEIQAKATRRDEFPRIFTDIHLHFIISADEVDEKALDRAVKLSADKYCSVSAMLSPSVNITHSHELIESAETE